MDVNQSHLTRHRMAVQGPDRVPDQVRHQLVADLLQTLPGGGGHIVASLDVVLLLARASCPSCVAVSLTVDPEDQSVTIAAIRSNGHRRAPAMTVTLPRPSTNGPARQPAVLVVFATDTVALTRRGVLLDQGWVPTEGRSELQRRADDDGASLAQAAATVLSALPGATPQRPS